MLRLLKYCSTLPKKPFQTERTPKKLWTAVAFTKFEQTWPWSSMVHVGGFPFWRTLWLYAYQLLMNTMVYQGFGIPMGSEFLKFIWNHCSVSLQNFHGRDCDGWECSLRIRLVQTADGSVEWSAFNTTSGEVHFCRIRPIRGCPVVHTTALHLFFAAHWYVAASQFISCVLISAGVYRVSESLSIYLYTLLQWYPEIFWGRRRLDFLGVCHACHQRLMLSPLPLKPTGFQCRKLSTQSPVTFPMGIPGGL